MANELKITKCDATPSNVIIYFSEPLDTSKGVPTNIESYVVSPIGSDKSVLKASAPVYDVIAKATILQLDGKNAQKGDWLKVVVKNVISAHGEKIGGGGGSETYFVRVNGEKDDLEENARRATKAVEDSVTYPMMTEQVGNPPGSSFGGGGTGSGGSTGSGSLQLSQLATQTITNILGWKPKDNDDKGFVGALTQSFSLKDVEGHVEATWTPRTYAVQTDLAGGITGAQASLYMRAKEAMDQSLPLLDGLESLNPDSDSDMATALKEIVRSQITELTGEMGFAGGPRISRVNQYFHLLLGVDLPTQPPLPNQGIPHIPSEPDKVRGNLGRVRDELQLQSFSKYVNSVRHEQIITNFRILSDYLTSLAQSWVNNLKFFGLDSKHAFLGSQLVLLSRQLSVVADTVDEVRFTLDSVFIGAPERQTLQLEFGKDPALFIEDLLSWAQIFAKEEGPQLIQTSGKLGVGDGFLPIVRKLHHLVGEAREPINKSKLPDGYKTIRVKNSLRDLQDQLGELKRLAEGVSLVKPPLVFSDQIVQRITDKLKEDDRLIKDIKEEQVDEEQEEKESA